MDMTRISKFLSLILRHKPEEIGIKLDALKMHQDGYKFYLSKNGVWLTKNVPAKYLSVGVIEDDIGVNYNA